MLRDQRLGALTVVVRREHVIEWRVDRRPTTGKAEHRAMVAAIEHQHRLAPGEDPPERQGQEVGLGAGIGEAYSIQAKPLAHRTRELRLRQV